MKKILLFALPLFIFNTYIVAQEQEKGHQKQKTENVKHPKKHNGKHNGKHDNSAKNKNSKHKNNGTQGNAYGNNKNGLEGRDFGQQRAYEAKRIAQERKLYANQKIKIYDIIIGSNDERINLAKAKVEKQRKDGQISIQVEKEKLERIRMAEDKNKKIKALVEKNRKEIKALEKELNMID